MGLHNMYTPKHNDLHHDGVSSEQYVGAIILAVMFSRDTHADHIPHT